MRLTLADKHRLSNKIYNEYKLPVGGLRPISLSNEYKILFTEYCCRYTDAWVVEVSYFDGTVERWIVTYSGDAYFDDDDTWHIEMIQ